MAETCKECGCACNQCCQDDQKHGDMHLHVEIEHLRQRLLERDNHIVTMETQFLSEADKFPNGEVASMQEEILRWQDKYSRLYEAHKRVQKVNQNLEDKLLKIVDKCETEKGAFAKDIATLSHRLADANYTIHRLTQDNEKYRNDVNLAIQLLQCKPSNFVGQKYDSLPSEVQAKVRTYVAQKRRSSEAPLPEIKSITVPISTFPPTAMVYNVTKPNADKDSDDEKDESKPPVDIVSAAIMAKVLEDRERERIFAKHCDTCTCHRSILTNDTEVQTINVLDVYICNECGAKNVRNVQNATTDSAGNAESSIQSKDNNIKYNRSTLRSYESDDSSSKHTIFQEFNQNSLNNTKSRFKSPDGNAANTNFQCVKEKADVQNAQNCETLKIDNSTKDYLNIKNASHRQGASDASNGKIAKSSQTYPRQSQTDNEIKQSSQNTVKFISKTSADKARQAKHARKPDFHVGSKFISNDSCNSERNSSQCDRSDLRNPDANAKIRKEQTHIDVINDRLWKNEWSRSKSALNSTNSDRQALGREHRIDIINDRIWRNEKSRMEDGKSSYLTVIEVASTNHSINQNDCKHTENAASPSFSSDSVVISTSDPPSSSSDPVHIVNEKMSAYSNSVKSSWQDRTTGPRNCFVRVTSGSKNILLDNAGHYQTVLYTSGSSKPNTALVHAKSSRSGRSASTSSEENSSILPHDNLQLQRVAEWVQSSSPIDTLSNSSNAPQFRDAVSSKLENNSSIRDNESKLECNKNLGENAKKGRSNYEKQYNSQLSRVSSELMWEMNSQCSYVNICDDGVKHESSSQTTAKSKTEIDEDLITFELSNDEKEARSVQDFVKSDSTPELNYEVKITKEMEETYLMLAASLDPVTLHLPSSSGTDLTIEKYRKDHKRVQGQKIQNTSGSSV